jgi:Na+/H+ antiporter NhaD/arsenite permease-like protein
MIRIIAIVVSLAAIAFVLYLLYGKNQKSWNELTVEEQKKKKIAITGGIMVFLAGVITSFIYGKKK